MSYQIKFQDLTQLHAEIKPQLNAVFEQCLEKSSFIQGQLVKDFEKEFAAFTGGNFCLGVANGTDALEMALEALRLPVGSTVVVPAFTFAATAEAVVRQGHKPLFVDVDETTGCLTLPLLKTLFDKASQKPAAVLLVHLYGRAASDVAAMAEWCDSKNVALIEDCAQAHGATVQTPHGAKNVGCFGAVSTFSFYPGKNLGALGDGGALVTSSQDLHTRLKLLRDHGRTDKYVHATVGRNSRLDSMQAGFLSVKLKHLQKWNEKRRVVAQRYYKGLQEASGIQLMKRPENEQEHVYHLFVVKVLGGKRDALKKYLADQGVECLIHYPGALTKQEAFRPWIGSTAYGVSENLADQVLSLPMDPNLKDHEVDFVCEKLKGFFK